MHELGPTRNIVSIVSDNSGAPAVRRVRLAVGPRACVEKAALSLCSEVVAQGAPLANARLEFVDPSGDTLLIRDFECEGRPPDVR
jgi:hydrogenase nickel incorporation protein HypA/HybF